MGSGLFSTWREGERQICEPKSQWFTFGSLTPYRFEKNRPLGHVNCQGSLLQMARPSTAIQPWQRTGPVPNRCKPWCNRLEIQSVFAGGGIETTWWREGEAYKAPA